MRYLMINIKVFIVIFLFCFSCTSQNKYEIKIKEGTNCYISAKQVSDLLTQEYLSTIDTYKDMYDEYNITFSKEQSNIVRRFETILNGIKNKDLYLDLVANIPVYYEYEDSIDCKVFFGVKRINISYNKIN